ncbi:hypothetical protein ACH40D_20825 [Streptomyces olivaceoviridis]|uniref:HNH endonuclease n=1 Tax=Streptomyces olivaceoviridis TaxID=1921 RepID=A0ABW7VHV9_STROI|nr:AP2 domain-containing protein [Streptomyces corchorusii]
MPYHVTEIPVGTRYGRLVTIAVPHLRPRSDGRNRAWVRVKCDCGSKPKDVVAGNLLSGITASCGCLHRERASEANTVHGHATGYQRTRLLRIWRGMRTRCNNPEAANYKHYGGKGITHCDEWDTFTPFMEWAMANGYADGLELDRIDPDKNYTPKNCRWVTKRQNIRNRDRVWSDNLDAALVAYAKTVDVNPYEVIKEAVVQYLAEHAGYPAETEET